MASNISEWFQNEQSKETSYLLGSKTTIYRKYTIEKALLTCNQQVHDLLFLNE